MNPDSKIEQELTNLGQQLGAQGSMKHSVLEQIAREGAAPPVPHRGLRINWSISLGSALAASLLVVLFVHLGNEQSTSSGSLYAQAIEAMQSAKSLHIIVKQVEDDAPASIPEAAKLHVVLEAFYERGVGFREENSREGQQAKIIIDDTQHEWLITPSVVQRRKSADAFAALVKKVIEPDKLLQGTKRDSSGDENINGESLQLYVLEKGENGITTRSRAWLDASKRLRRLEEVETSNDGQYHTHLIGEISYDLTIDHKLFVATPPPQTKIVDVDEVVEKNFSLDKALYKQEVLGMTFAVHRVEQLSRSHGILAVVSSIRPTDETRRLVGPVEPDMHNFAEYQLKDLSAPSKHYKYDIYELRYHSDRGLMVKWCVLIPSGWWPDESTSHSQYIPSFNISAVGAWADYLKKAGRQTWEDASPDVKIPATDKKLALADFAKDVYTQASELGGNFVMNSTPLSDQEMQPLWDKGGVPRYQRLLRERTSGLGNLTLEQFQQAVQSRCLW